MQSAVLDTAPCDILNAINTMIVDHFLCCSQDISQFTYSVLSPKNNLKAFLKFTVTEHSSETMPCFDWFVFVGATIFRIYQSLFSDYIDCMFIAEGE